GLRQRRLDIADRLHGLRIGVFVPDHFSIGICRRRACYVNVRSHSHRPRVAHNRLPRRPRRNILAFHFVSCEFALVQTIITLEPMGFLCWLGVPRNPPRVSSVLCVLCILCVLCV